jgi:predicted RNA-binding Zn-ribbon protein involved in translation (DUF1610 family)
MEAVIADLMTRMEQLEAQHGATEEERAILELCDACGETMEKRHVYQNGKQVDTVYKCASCKHTVQAELID